MRALLRPLLPSAVLVAEMDPREADPRSLLPEEAACVVKAVEKRRREFAAGRMMARRLLATLGLGDDAPLLPGPQREPTWPTGIVGTITHTASWAGVALAPAHVCGGLGADVEQDTPMKPEVARRICVPSEIGWLDARFPDPELRGRWAKVIFSAKEAAYKAQFPKSRKFLGFDAMSIEIDGDGGDFVATFRVDAPPFRVGMTLRGRFLVQDGLIATGISLPVDAPRGGV